MKRLLQQVVLLVAIAASGAAFSASTDGCSGDRVRVVTQRGAFESFDASCVSSSWALAEMLNRARQAYVWTAVSCSADPVAVGTVYTLNLASRITGSDAGNDTATISAIPCTLPDASDLRVYSINEILVLVGGILAFGIGFVIGK